MVIPPRFVNIPSQLAYEATLPDALFRSYVRLRGLAWQSNYKQTPPLTIEELAVLIHHNVRSAWGHLSQLRARGLLTWTSTPRGLVLRFEEAEESLQNFAVHHDHDYAADNQSNPAAASALMQDFAVQNFAVNTNGRRDAVLLALAEYGVDVSAVGDLLELEHVTPELVHTWGRRLAQQGNVRNLAGLLVYKLRTAPQPPRAEERRGGARGTAVVTCPQCYLVKPLEQICSDCGLCYDCCKC